MLFKKLLLSGLLALSSHVAFSQLMVSGTVQHNECFGVNSGAIDLIVEGGVPPYEYEWSIGAFTEDLNYLEAGVYTVIVRDQAEVKNEEQVSFAVENGIYIDIAGTITEVTCVSGGSVQVDVVGGVGPYTYRWSNGYGENKITDLDPGNYEVMVVDTRGCSGFATFNVPGPSPISVTLITDMANCAGTGGSIDLTVAGGAAPFQYTWSTGATTEDLSSLTTGTYSVTVTDAAGCQVNGSATITQDPSLSLTAVKQNVSCSGISNGAIDVTITGGTAPFSYQWSNGVATQDISGLAAGTYSLRVTDARNCQASLSVTIESSVPMSLQMSVQPSTACEDVLSNGAIQLQISGGTAPYTYRWTDGATEAMRTGLKYGSYAVTIVDATGCSIGPTEVVVPHAPDVPTLVLSSVPNESCDATQATGSISAWVSSTSEYHFELFQQQGSVPVASGSKLANESLSINTLAGGIYRLEVVSANGCRTIAEIGVTDDLTGPVITAVSTTPQTHCSTANGSASITGMSHKGVSGLVSEYIYEWVDTHGNVIASGASVSNLAAGLYMVNATKLANPGAGCAFTSFEVMVLFDPVLPTIALSSTPNTSCDELLQNGTVSAEITSPTADYSWYWSIEGKGVVAAGTESTPTTLTGLALGEYEFTLTPANGCAVTAVTTVSEEIAEYTLVYQKGDNPCDGEMNGWIRVEKQPDYAYSFRKGDLSLSPAADGSLTGLAAGTYQVEVVHNVTGCVYMNAVAITEPSPLRITELVGQISAYGASDGSIGVTVTGGTAPYNYLWSTGATSPELTELGPQTYSVTVTDAQNCSQTLSVAIEAPLSLGKYELEAPISVSRTANGQLRVQFEQVPHTQELAVYQLDGTLVSIIKLKGSMEVEVSLPDAEPSVFLLVLTSKGNVYRKKILF